MTAATGKLRVAVAGAAGKMGRTLIRVVAESAEAKLVGALERDGHPDMGADAGTLAGLAEQGLAVTAKLEDALKNAQVLVEFTAPATATELAHAAEARGIALVVGTTGLGPEERQAIERAAARIPVVLSPNMSVGVNLALRLLETAARTLGEGFDVEIVESHHRLKKDAPSGTALRMAEVIAQASGRELASSLVAGRQGQVGARRPGEIGVLALRGGDVVGEHTVHFLGLGERLEITHRASSRDTFARGALRAALWLRGRKPGLYSMQDVLGI